MTPRIEWVGCEEHNDDLWIHPRDLPLPHEDCPLCHLLVETRQENIAILRDRIAINEAEIAEIERGDRHNEFHRRNQNSVEWHVGHPGCTCPRGTAAGLVLKCPVHDD